MRFNIFTKLLLILLIVSLIPMLLIGSLGLRNSNNIQRVSAEANASIAQVAMKDSMSSLSQEKKEDLQVRAKALADAIELALRQVQADTLQLADFARYLYEHEETVGRYGLGQDNQYIYSSNGVFGSGQPNDNSWLALFPLGLDADGKIPPKTLEEVYLTEFLDISFRSIAQTNPYAVQLYINTPGHMTRGMRFVQGEYIWVNGFEEFGTDLNMEDFDFFYLADPKHNPSRSPVWTGVYWDPAGAGWLVSSIAPVYAGDVFKAVVGIDITVDRLIGGLLDVKLEKSGFAFLMSETGQAIAFPELSHSFLGYQPPEEKEFVDDQEFAFYLTQSKEPSFLAVINTMKKGESGLITYQSLNTQREYYWDYQTIPTTKWSVGVVVPVDEVVAPALQTNQTIQASTNKTSADLLARSDKLTRDLSLTLAVLTIGMVPLAYIVSRNISNPIRTLEYGSRRIGDGELNHRITVRSGDEIEELAVTFNQMADNLQTKVEEIETANEELRALDKVKSQFISMASHELRTPLIAIRGYVDLLKEGEAGPVSQEQETMLATVSRNTHRLARIVSELLDISRIQENQLILREEDVQLNEVITEVVMELQPSIQKRHHTVELRLSAELPLCLGDRDRLSQIIINLMGNAIKYTPDGGKIRLSTRRGDDSKTIQLAVQDNGIGISPENQSRIFTRFFGVQNIEQHKTGKDEFLAGGTGLGLAIVKGLVEAHRGTITVQSELNVGSTFTVTLPIHHQERNQANHWVEKEAEVQNIYRVKQWHTPTPTKQSAEPKNKAKILLIEDEDDTIKVVERILREEYDIITASTSATGLKQALMTSPDFILLDAWMTGLSGYEICRTLKNNPRTQHIPIALFSAATQQADEERAKGCGADAFLTKPFLREGLIQLVRQYCG